MSESTEWGSRRNYLTGLTHVSGLQSIHAHARECRYGITTGLFSSRPIGTNAVRWEMGSSTTSRVLGLVRAAPFDGFHQLLILLMETGLRFLGTAICSQALAGTQECRERSDRWHAVTAPRRGFKLSWTKSTGRRTRTKTKRRAPNNCVTDSG